MYSIADSYIDQGVQQGVLKGKAERNIEIARKLLEQKVDVKVISSATELSVEGIKKLTSLESAQLNLY